MQSGAIDVDIASTSATLRPIVQQGGVVAPPPMRPRQQQPPSAANVPAPQHLQHHGQPVAQVRIQQPTPVGYLSASRSPVQILVAPQAGVPVHHQPVQPHYVMQVPGGGIQNLQVYSTRLYFAASNGASERRQSAVRAASPYDNWRPSAAVYSRPTRRCPESRYGVRAASSCCRWTWGYCKWIVDRRFQWRGWLGPGSRQPPYHSSTK